MLDFIITAGVYFRSLSYVMHQKPRYSPFAVIYWPNLALNTAACPPGNRSIVELFGVDIWCPPWFNIIEIHRWWGETKNEGGAKKQ